MSWWTGWWTSWWWWTSWQTSCWARRSYLFDVGAGSISPAPQPAHCHHDCHPAQLPVSGLLTKMASQAFMASRWAPGPQAPCAPLGHSSASKMLPSGHANANIRKCLCARTISTGPALPVCRAHFKDTFTSWHSGKNCVLNKFFYIIPELLFFSKSNHILINSQVLNWNLKKCVHFPITSMKKYHTFFSQ